MTTTGDHVMTTGDHWSIQWPYTYEVMMLSLKWESNYPGVQVHQEGRQKLEDFLIAKLCSTSSQDKRNQSLIDDR